MAIQLTNAAATAAADAVVDLIDGGPAAGVVEIRTGAMPATADAADTGTVLASLTFTDPAFATPTNGVASANPITQDIADASGTAGHFRVKTSAGSTIFQGTVTATGGGGDMTLISTAITVGQPVQLSSFTYTAPKA